MDPNHLFIGYQLTSKDMLKLGVQGQSSLETPIESSPFDNLEHQVRKINQPASTT